MSNNSSHQARPTSEGKAIDKPLVSHTQTMLLLVLLYGLACKNTGVGSGLVSRASSRLDECSLV